MSRDETTSRMLLATALVAVLIVAREGRGAEGDFPFVAGEAPHSVSFGDVQDGRLIRGVWLEESDHLKVLPTQKARGYRWGTSELVTLLHEAANALHEATGTRLWVGHLSKKGGGDIAYSVSHNAGRDADLAYCYRDADGNPIEVEELIPVFGNGHTSKQGVFLDVPRTWEVVKLLATSREPKVQYMFVSRGIEKLLLKHAVAEGEPFRTRALAKLVMHQPGMRAAKHIDHIHVRLHCTEQDVLAGCRDSGGRAHRFSRIYRHRLEQFARGLRSHLTSDDADERRLALERLGLLRASYVAKDVADRLGDASPPVQRAAAAALVSFGRPSHLTLVRRWLQSLDDADRARAARVFARQPGEEQADMLADLLDAATGRHVLTVIDAVGDSGHLACIPALVRRLEDRDAKVRERAAAALGRLTAHRYVDDWSKLDDATGARMRDKWRHLWGASRHLSREEWLLRGFRDAGYDVARFEPDQAWPLVAALSGPEHLADNATRQLQSLFGRRSSCAGWRRWLSARRSAFALPAPPAKICR